MRYVETAGFRHLYIAYRLDCTMMQLGVRSTHAQPRTLQAAFYEDMALLSFPFVSAESTEPLPFSNTLKYDANGWSQTFSDVMGPDLGFPQLDLSDLIEMLEQEGEAEGTVQSLQMNHQPENMMLRTSVEANEGCFWRELSTFSDPGD